MCEACEVKGLHDPSHPRTKLGRPSAESIEHAESRAEIARLKAELSTARLQVVLNNVMASLGQATKK